jgi:tetratricopeptide (TPR) repeat protein
LSKRHARAWGVRGALRRSCLRHAACDVIGNTDSPPETAGAGFPMSSHASALEHFRQGREDLRDEALDRALAHFRTAHRLDPGSAQYRSFYGLGLGLCERRWEQALELCRSAARDEFFDPIHYHNLARLHLAFGFKGDALRLVKRGLMIAPDHEELVALLRRLGVRKRPPLGFLRRENTLNRWLGKLIERMRVEPGPEPSPSA